IAPMRGLSARDARKIYNELEIRSYILNKLVEMDVTDYYEVYSAISKVYDNPYIADMEFNLATTTIIDKILRGDIK
ncbi:MAG: hypothetical protein QXW27_03380, partial [Candidatus Methanomethylicaceae archaeon]